MSHRRQILEHMTAAEWPLSCPPLEPASWPPASPADVAQATDALVHLGELAMAFGKIDRTACYHPDRVTKESDTDHTVMLGWLACAIAARWFPELDLGLVAQFALVHDAVEVYAGDTQTLRITPEEREQKAVREAASLDRIGDEFGPVLPWFPELIRRYEWQHAPEARYIKAMDKFLPKIVHLLDRMAGLREFGIDKPELETMLAAQTEAVARYAGEFEMLMEIRAELTRRLLAHPNWREDGTIAEESAP